MIKNCPYCGNDYKTYKRRQVHCSVGCALLMNKNLRWPPERIAEATRLYVSMPIKEARERLGLTKGQLAGAMWRAGISKTERTPAVLSRFDFDPRACRWPKGEPRNPDFHYCGAKLADGHRWLDLPYCDHHMEVAIRKL